MRSELSQALQIPLYSRKVCGSLTRGDLKHDSNEAQQAGNKTFAFGG